MTDINHRRDAKKYSTKFFTCDKIMHVEDKYMGWEGEGCWSRKSRKLLKRRWNKYKRAYAKRLSESLALAEDFDFANVSE